MSETIARPTLGLAAHAYTAATAKPQSLPHSAPAKRRKTIKARPVDAAALLDVRDLTIPGGPTDETWLRVFRSAGATEPLPVVMYIHGGDQVFGNVRTRRLATNLAIDLQAAVVVVDYSLSPKARYPVATEENYVAAAWVAKHGNEHGLDGTRIAVAADSAGGDMADELVLMADKRDGPVLAAHVMTRPGVRVTASSSGFRGCSGCGVTADIRRPYLLDEESNTVVA
jgi:acetyl esterase